MSKRDEKGRFKKGVDQRYYMNDHGGHTKKLQDIMKKRKRKKSA